MYEIKREVWWEVAGALFERIFDAMAYAAEEAEDIGYFPVPEQFERYAVVVMGKKYGAYDSLEEAEAVVYDLMGREGHA